MSRIQRKAARSVAARERPACGHFERRHINDRQLVFVLEIDVEVTGRIADRELRLAVSITLALSLPPLNATTRWVYGSYKIASGLTPTAMLSITSRVRKSNTLTRLVIPALMYPRPRSVASAMPCTPGVSAMSPTTLPLAISTMATCVARDKYKRCAVGSTL